MPLYHHDGRPYQVAAEAAAQRARDKFEDIIGAGTAKAVRVLEAVQTDIPNDYVVPAPRLEFYDNEDPLAPVGLSFNTGDAVEDLGLHPLALRQVTDRVGIPKTFVDRLLDVEKEQERGWRRQLLIHNLEELYGHQTDRYLVREVRGQARGFLSNRFRRMDSGPIIESFIQAFQSVGAVPVEGYYSDVRWAIKAMLPCVFEPIPNEVFILGVVLQNSDYGHGALSLREFMMRLWCTNYAIVDAPLRRVHLGRRLTEDMDFSLETHNADTKAMALAVRDMVTNMMQPEATTRLCDTIVQAHEEKIEAHEVAAFLRKNFSKKDAAAITDYYNSADVERLPAGQSRLRLSNAISLLAGDAEDALQKLELQQVAGKALAA